jgi:transcriptional regulator with XRE-family HTH domain
LPPRKGRKAIEPSHPLLKELDYTREILKISRTDLAVRIGMPSSALSRLMAGRSSPTLATLDKICEVLGVHVILDVQFKKEKIS